MIGTLAALLFQQGLHQFKYLKEPTLPQRGLYYVKPVNHDGTYGCMPLQEWPSSFQ